MSNSPGGQEFEQNKWQHEKMVLELQQENLRLSSENLKLSTKQLRRYWFFTAVSFALGIAGTIIAQRCTDKSEEVHLLRDRITLLESIAAKKETCLHPAGIESNQNTKGRDGKDSLKDSRK
jgi:hypothetical protein